MTIPDWLSQPCPYVQAGSQATIINVLSLKEADGWLEQQTSATRAWLQATGFDGKAGQYGLLPGEQGIDSAVVVIDEPLWSLAPLVGELPQGTYQIQLSEACDIAMMPYLALGWGLAQYQFNRYKPTDTGLRYLLCQDPEVIMQWQAICLVRDLINTPAEHMNPQNLADVAQQVADRYAARHRVVEGEALLRENFPLTHAVGRAGSVAPRLIEINWGDKSHPKLALVGKGVCFDSGGLDLKTSSGMLLMKKDMGGAAHVLGLAALIMQTKLPVQLQVLIPAVENNVAANSFRPGDVFKTRQGLYVEIGNTDAEGRLVLSDALTYASEDKPDLIIDFATLTGAARVALGAELPALFSNDLSMGQHCVNLSVTHYDPLWLMPLHQPYKRQLKSEMADLNNAPGGGYGGAITAGLFLEHFVNEIPWMHIDLMAYNITAQPGRPKGGEAMGLRSMFAYLQQRYTH